MSGIRTIRETRCNVKKLKPVTLKLNTAFKPLHRVIGTNLQDMIRDHYLLQVFDRWSILSLFFMDEIGAEGVQTQINHLHSFNPEIIFNILAKSEKSKAIRGEDGYYNFRTINHKESGTRQDITVVPGIQPQSIKAVRTSDKGIAKSTARTEEHVALPEIKGSMLFKTTASMLRELVRRQDSYNYWLTGNADNVDRIGISTGEKAVTKTPQNNISAFKAIIDNTPDIKLLTSLFINNDKQANLYYMEEPGEKKGFKAQEHQKGIAGLTRYTAMLQKVENRLEAIYRNTEFKSDQWSAGSKNISYEDVQNLQDVNGSGKLIESISKILISEEKQANRNTGIEIDSPKFRNMFKTVQQRFKGRLKEYSSVNRQDIDESGTTEGFNLYGGAAEQYFAALEHEDIRYIKHGDSRIHIIAGILGRYLNAGQKGSSGILKELGTTGEGEHAESFTGNMTGYAALGILGKTIIDKINYRVRNIVEKASASDAGFTGRGYSGLAGGGIEYREFDGQNGEGALSKGKILGTEFQRELRTAVKAKLLEELQSKYETEINSTVNKETSKETRNEIIKDSIKEIKIRLLKELQIKYDTELNKAFNSEINYTAGKEIGKNLKKGLNTELIKVLNEKFNKELYKEIFREVENELSKEINKEIRKDTQVEVHKLSTDLQRYQAEIPDRSNTERIISNILSRYVVGKFGEKRELKWNYEAAQTSENVSRKYGDTILNREDKAIVEVGGDIHKADVFGTYPQQVDYKGDTYFNISDRTGLYGKSEEAPRIISKWGNEITKLFERHLKAGTKGTAAVNTITGRSEDSGTNKALAPSDALLNYERSSETLVYQESGSSGQGFGYKDGSNAVNINNASILKSLGSRIAEKTVKRIKSITTVLLPHQAYLHADNYLKSFREEVNPSRNVQNLQSLQQNSKLENPVNQYHTSNVLETLDKQHIHDVDKNENIWDKASKKRIKNTEPSPLGRALVDRLMKNVMHTLTQNRFNRYLSGKENFEKAIEKNIFLSQQAGISNASNLVRNYSSFRTELEGIQKVFALGAPGPSRDSKAAGISSPEGKDFQPMMDTVGSINGNKMTQAALTHTLMGKRIQQANDSMSAGLVRQDIGKAIRKSQISLTDNESREAVLKRRAANQSELKLLQNNEHLVLSGKINYQDKSRNAPEMVVLAPPVTVQDYSQGYTKNLPPITHKTEEAAPQKQQKSEPVMKSLNTPLDTQSKTIRNTISDVDLMSHTELNKLVDKVYSQLETRLARERRRFGL